MSLADASSCLVAHLQRVAADLQTIEHALEAEFRRRYANEVNPMDLLHKLRKLRRDLPDIQKDCQSVLAAKQELVDAARSGLLSNQQTLANLQCKAGVPVEAGSEDDAFHAAMAEFDRVLRVDMPDEPQMETDRRQALNEVLMQTVL